MKRLILIWVLLILLPVATALDLSNYPDQFFMEDDFNAVIVIGRSAPSQDVTSAVDLIPSLQDKSDVRIGQAKLDEEIGEYDLESSHVISVGTPCDNTVTERIMDFEDSCSEAFKEGEGYIYLYKSGLGRAWLVIAGGTPDDTQKAARVLGTYEEYDLSGNALKVTGSEAPYEVERISLYGKEEEQAEEVQEEASEEAIEEVVEEQEEQQEQVTESEREKRLRERINSLLEEENEEVQEVSVEEEPAEIPNEEETFLERAWNGFKEWLMWFFK